MMLTQKPKTIIAFITALLLPTSTTLASSSRQQCKSCVGDGCVYCKGSGQCLCVNKFIDSVVDGFNNGGGGARNLFATLDDNFFPPADDVFQNGGFPSGDDFAFNGDSPFPNNDNNQNGIGDDFFNNDFVEDVLSCDLDSVPLSSNLDCTFNSHRSGLILTAILIGGIVLLATCGFFIFRSFNTRTKSTAPVASMVEGTADDVSKDNADGEEGSPVVEVHDQPMQEQPASVAVPFGSNNATEG